MADQQRQLAQLQYNMQVRDDRNKAGYNGYHPVDSYFNKLNSHDTRSGQFNPKGPIGTGYYGGVHRRSSGSKRSGSKRSGGSRRRHGGSRRRHGGSRRRH